VNASVKEAGRAAAEAAVLELERQRAVDRELGREDARLQAEEGMTAREGMGAGRGEEQEEEGEGSDPRGQVYEQLPEDEGSSKARSLALRSGGRPKFSFPLAPAEEEEGSVRLPTRLTITDVDVYAYSRMLHAGHSWIAVHRTSCPCLPMPPPVMGVSLALHSKGGWMTSWIVLWTMQWRPCGSR
jgi:hypothetical protein